MKYKVKLTRRQFLKGTAAAGVLLGAGGGRVLVKKALADNRAREVKFVRTTCSPNCTSACGIKAMVVDGQIKALFPTNDYPDPEYNPRGCLRGISFINLIYGPDRLKGPRIKEGGRGLKGKFRDVSWEEALDYTARRLKEIAEKYGPESIGVSFQVGGTGYVHKGAMVALATLAGWTLHHAYDLNGDLPMFWPQTFGVQTEELEPLEWVNSRYTAIFGSNVMVTRLIDSDLLLESKKRGGKVVVFDPNYSPTAAKADEFYRIKVSSDAALALGIARIIVEEKLYDEPFIKTYTDLPLLVRLDNGKRLKAADVAGLALPAGVSPYRDVFVAYNGKFLAVNPEKLEMPLDVALEGEYTVTLKNGQTVKVKPIFQLLKESLKVYTPEFVERETGVKAEDVVKIAREMATIKPLHIIYGASNYQWYHGDLKGRALALIVVLTGNLGKPGAGISTYAGQYRIRLKVNKWWFPEGKKAKWYPWLYILHGPTENMVAPKPKNGIKALIFGWHNPFDQHNMANRLREMVEKGELEFVVAIDFQNSTSCQWSDVVLPGVTWYEKTELTATPVHPYLQLQQPAIKPLYNCKPELWIFRELAKRINPEFEKHFFPGLDPDKAAEKAIELMLATGGPTVAGITLEQLKKGPVRLKLGTPGNRQIMFYEQIVEKKPFPPESLPVPLEKTAQFVKSGRIEFYKDEDIFLKLGEQLPVYKPPFEESEYALDPSSKGKYQFAFITRNSLYRVHSTHSNNIWMEELHNNKPKVFLNPKDAETKGIKEGDLVEVYNSRGKVKGYAVLDPGIGEKVIVFEQGWWSRYLKETSYNSLTYPFIKPTHEVYFVPGVWSPNTAWNECLCDVRKVGES
ncbi:molybdopterin-dependent oxidoreductase [Carboxydothermus hydrogenoformans]|uniref:Probable respiratory nitrate reductase alpha subunit n=1 Tax=Carboxydothermus hydrogenoformans (strain ATCC BAA-161 / DSM 6008 / Z-2901) TaxID=246194 RepID=Q3AAD3_CARHZ|nr:molybdopterin-dependent oxidoreductase [Carboxydothermus hydrogenoformans]ABB15127.1 probable respiratory nitrate reductase alpha subunit [Carboxydothermus hydrogenoformans Z-2901]